MIAEVLRLHTGNPDCLSLLNISCDSGVRQEFHVGLNTVNAVNSGQLVVRRPSADIVCSEPSRSPHLMALVRFSGPGPGAPCCGARILCCRASALTFGHVICVMFTNVAKGFDCIVIAPIAWHAMGVEFDLTTTLSPGVCLSATFNPRPSHIANSKLQSQ